MRIAGRCHTNNALVQVIAEMQLDLRDKSVLVETLEKEKAGERSIDRSKAEAEAEAFN